MAYGMICDQRRQFSYPYREALHQMKVAKESVRPTASKNLLEVTQNITRHHHVNAGRGCYGLRVRGRNHRT